MRRRIHPARRRGVAAIELGFVTMLFVVPLIIGIWEIGRYIHVQQVVANGAREGARLAAQGFTLRPDGSSVEIVKYSSQSNVINVKDVVCDYLRAAGLNTITPDDVTVTFKFTPEAGYNDSLTEPYQGIKNQPFTVSVSIPWNKVRWVNLGMLQSNDVYFVVKWRMMIDDEFTINENLPAW